MPYRRIRGMILRFVRRRAYAICAGLALAIPAAWIEFGSRTDAWWVQGLALIGGATGVALIWTGLTGISPDWID